MYISYIDYQQLGSTPMPEYDFLRRAMEAEKIIDDLTTGVDGICKLRVAFPTDPHDVQTIKVCMAIMISNLGDVDAVKEKMKEDGGGVIASKSSGSESISYATGTVPDDAKAAVSEEYRREKLRNIARFWLRDIQDCNGVNLLYGGRYDV